MPARRDPDLLAVTGMVFDVKRFATGDGPGIRGLVFLKGCPLRCAWCENPESQIETAEIMYHATRCVACGRCVEACARDAIHADKIFGLVVDRNRCTLCGACVSVCLYEAREIVGERRTVGELLSLLRRDRRYYDHSGGGVTLTGGEPLAQVAFCRALLHACKAEGLHTAMETSGYARWDALDTILGDLDLLLYDLKHIDPEAHTRGTGKDNALILDNLARAARKGGTKIVIRVPVIPGFNDAPEVLERIFQFVKGLGGVDHVELLPYHRLGMSKYAGLGRPYGLRDLPPASKRDLEPLSALGAALGLRVVVDAE